MSDMDDTGTMWCPHCGAAYREGFVEFVDCRVCAVPLTSTRPTLTDDGRADVIDLADRERERDTVPERPAP